MGPGGNESPAGVMTSPALLSASSICFFVRPNGAAGNELVGPFSLFPLFSFALLFPLLLSDGFEEAVAVGHDSLKFPRDFSCLRTAKLSSGNLPARHLTRCLISIATVCIASGMVCWTLLN